MSILVTDRVGPNLSRGSELLLRWLTRHKVSQTELARRLSARSAQITKLVHGDRRPGLELALALQKSCAISPATWNQPASDAYRAKLRAVRAA